MSGMHERYVQRRPIVDLFINSDSRSSVGHVRDKSAEGIAIKGGLVPVVEHLSARGVTMDRITKMFTSEGRMKVAELSPFDVYQKEPDVVNNWLRIILQPAYDLIDPSMNNIFPGGINLHGIEHADAVTNTTDSLLIAAGADVDTRRRGIIAARGHDLGNLLTRDYHSLVSPAILYRLAPELLRSSSDFETISNAVIFHNVNSVSAIEPRWDTWNAEEKIAWVRAMGPEACALFIADKTDVGRQRVNPLPYNVSVDNFDRHTQLNLLSRTNGVTLTDDGKDLVWDMDFDPSMTEEEASVYPHLHKRRSDTGMIRAIASAKHHYLHRNEGIPLFDTWKSELWKLYFERTELAIFAAFALFPDLDAFEIRVHDKDGNSASIEDASYPIRRDGLDHTLAKMRKRYIPKDERKPANGAPQRHLV